MCPVSDPVRIGILGDFNPEFHSHVATNESLQHAAQRLQIEIQSEWLPTPSLLEAHAAKILETFDGLWASAGSPYKSFAGMLNGIEFARVHDWPFLGTCGGFQYTLIECARNVLGIADATTAEVVGPIMAEHRIVVYEMAGSGESLEQLFFAMTEGTAPSPGVGR